MACLAHPWHQIPPNIPTGTGWNASTPLTGPTAPTQFELGLSDWLPTEVLLRYGSMWEWYFRALYFSVSTLTGLGKRQPPLPKIGRAHV